MDVFFCFGTVWPFSSRWVASLCQSVHKPTAFLYCLSVPTVHFLQEKVLLADACGGPCIHGVCLGSRGSNGRLRWRHITARTENYRHSLAGQKCSQAIVLGIFNFAVHPISCLTGLSSEKSCLYTVFRGGNPFLHARGQGIM